MEPPAGWLVQLQVACLLALVAAADPVRAEDAQPPATAVVRATEWEKAFARESGWIGGDVVGSIPLESGRLLWVFGDSWIGRIETGRRVGGAELVNNALAVTRHDPRTGLADPAATRFFWGKPNDKGKQTAWVAPSSPAGALPTGDGQPDWYWPTGGGCAIPRAGGEGRLVISLFRVERTKGKGIWNFRTAGSVLVVVDHPAAKVEDWKLVQHPMPAEFVAGKRPSADPSSATSAAWQATWGQAMLVLPPEATDKKAPGKVLIYGQRSAPGGRSELLLARTSADSLTDFSTWEFAAERETWQRDPAAAKALTEGVASEFSVTRTEMDGRERFILITSAPLLGPQIQARTAPTPQGPWSDAKVIHTSAEVSKHHSYFAYAAKGRLEGAPPGELLISYAVNSHDFGRGFSDASIYFPQFVRIPLTRLPSPPANTP